MRIRFMAGACAKGVSTAATVIRVRRIRANQRPYHTPRRAKIAVNLSSEPW
jgi:hypothetical protein